MARWRLTASHYLNLVEETKWEYTEVDRSNGRMKRTQFVVPRHLDINEAADWTEKQYGMDGKPIEGYIIVCDGNNPGKNDLIYKGKPTPDMHPLDDDAEKITARYREIWNMSQDMEPGTYARSLIDNFERQFEELRLKQLSSIKSTPAEIPGMADFMSSMTAIMAKQTELLESMSKSSVRRA